MAAGCWLLAASGAAAGPGAAPAPPAVVVAGRISHPAARLVTLSYAPTEARLGYAGRFTSLYLAPGYSLRVRFNARQPDETVRYAGRGAAENNCLAQSHLAASQDDAAGRTPDVRAASLGAAALCQAAAAYRRQQLAALGAYAQAHPLLAAFVRQQCQALTYEWASTLLGYYARQAEARRQQGYATLPAGYYNFVPALRRQFAGRGVVFIYVSLDAQATAWQRALAAHNLLVPRAVHLHDGRGFAGEAARLWHASATQPLANWARWPHSGQQATAPLGGPLPRGGPRSRPETLGPARRFSGLAAEPANRVACELRTFRPPRSVSYLR